MTQINQVLNTFQFCYTIITVYPGTRLIATEFQFPLVTSYSAPKTFPSIYIGPKLGRSDDCLAILHVSPMHSQHGQPLFSGFFQALEQQAEHGELHQNSKSRYLRRPLHTWTIPAVFYSGPGTGSVVPSRTQTCLIYQNKYKLIVSLTLTFIVIGFMWEEF